MTTAAYYFPLWGVFAAVDVLLALAIAASALLRRRSTRLYHHRKDHR